MARIVRCGPNEAIVISGCCHKHVTIVQGGRAWAFWGNNVQKLSLNTMTIEVESKKVYTSEGVPISVTGVAQVKVQGQNREMLLTACELFVGKKNKEIKEVALQTLEGHQRAIMGRMTVEEIYKDRIKFSKNVFEVASSDLITMGLTVISYTIKDVTDEQQYLFSLGRARTAQVKRDARVGEALAKSEAAIKVSLAEEARMAAVLKNQTEISRADRDFQLKKYQFDAEVNTKNAEAELAYELQAAKTKQQIREQEMQIKIIERMQECQIQEQEIERRKLVLDATVKKEADAEKYRMVQLAQAAYKETILRAEAESTALRIKSEAEGYAISKKAQAEAEQMTLKAEAWNEYRDAAMIDMILTTLPMVAAEVAFPLTQINKVTMVSSGSGDVGAAKLTEDILGIVQKIPDLVESITGVNLNSYLKKVGQSK